MIRLIYYAILAYAIYALFRFFLNLGQKSRAARSGPRGAPVSGVMVKDDVCNTYVPVEDALREVVEGQEHYFCSEECRTKFHAQRKAARP
jgi:uncharacterized protein